MAEWRIGRGWSAAEIAERLQRAEALPLNFTAEYEAMKPSDGWNVYYSESIIAREPPGPPVSDGLFHKARLAVATYQLSDPTIVVGHFDASRPLLERRMLLEMKAMRLHFLAGVLVSAVRDEVREDRHEFGFRYDTLEGHIERGSEWFLVMKDTATGDIRLRIEASWLPGQFPTWWSRLGFYLFGQRYQKRWHHQAHQRLFTIAHEGLPPAPAVDRLGIAHAGPTVTFARTPRYTTVRTPDVAEAETVKNS